MSRGCYAENGPVEFNGAGCTVATTLLAHPRPVIIIIIAAAETERRSSCCDAGLISRRSPRRRRYVATVSQGSFTPDPARHGAAPRGAASRGVSAS